MGVEACEGMHVGHTPRSCPRRPPAWVRFGGVSGKRGGGEERKGSPLAAAESGVEKGRAGIPSVFEKALL